MNWNGDSTEHSAGDYILFAIGFLGFMFAAAGVVVTVPWLAVTGLLILTLSIITYSGQGFPG